MSEGVKGEEAAAPPRRAISPSIYDMAPRKRGFSIRISRLRNK